MSEVPQTPPPPPPSGRGNSSSNINADQVKAAVRSAHPFDLGIIGIGVLVFLLSLFPYYKASVSGTGSGVLGVVDPSTSWTAWHGFFGWFAALVALAVGALLALHLMGIRPLETGLTRLVALGGFGLATLCVLLALFVNPLPGESGDIGGGLSYDKGHGFGYWLSLLLVLGGLALSFLRKDARD